jgi:hypothetical protein
MKALPPTASRRRLQALLSVFLNLTEFLTRVTTTQRMKEDEFHVRKVLRKSGHGQ